MKPFLKLALPFALASNLYASVDAAGSTGSADHDTPGEVLVVEHAEIVLPGPDSDRYEAYLTIWNGTQVSASLRGVTTGEFGSVEIYRNNLGRDETVQGVLAIPGHSELKMRPGGVRLVLSRLLVLPEQIGDRPLMLEFDDGSSIAVRPRVVEASAELTDHHHGDRDLPGR